VIPVPWKLRVPSLGRQPGLPGAAFDHLWRAEARHRLDLQRLAPPGLAAAEQRAAAVLGDASGGEVGADATGSDLPRVAFVSCAAGSLSTSLPTEFSERKSDSAPTTDTAAGDHYRVNAPHACRSISQ